MIEEFTPDITKDLERFSEALKNKNTLTAVVMYLRYNNGTYEVLYTPSTKTFIAGALFTAATEVIVTKND